MRLHSGLTSNAHPLGQPSQFDLRLHQPELHSHLAVHRRRGGQVSLGLLLLASVPIELAEAEVATGEQRPHAKFFSQPDGSTV